MSLSQELLLDEISRMPLRHRIAFCASCCQRMLPNYEKFSRMENWGNPRLLVSALDEVWVFLAAEENAPTRFETLARECADAAPDTEEFSSLYTSSALDAASSLVETLRCGLDGEPLRAVQVARSATDSVDMYIQMRDNLAPSGSATEDAIANDPLMRREIEKQKADLATLGGAEELTPEFLTRFRQSAEYDLLDLRNRAE